MSFARAHLDEAKRIIDALDIGIIERMAETLATLRQRGGRLFFLGVGGSAGNCSHAVNDFRKLAGIEAYAPTDNVSELTARTNDEGWETVFVEWLKVSRLKASDAVFIFSVGGGNLEKNVSPTPRPSARPFSAWSDGMAATPHEWATRSASFRLSIRTP
jgi:D-sedoheptulose 7-phosphate isomerase